MSRFPVHEGGKPLSPRTEATLSIVQALFPIAASLATAIWVVNGYFDQQKASLEQQRTAEVARASEARKPFYEKQLTLYFEAARVAGALATLDPKSSQWADTKQRFYALYWSELSMVEDSRVEYGMVNFETTLANFDKDGSLRADVQRQSYCLAHALKDSISENWSINFGRGSETAIVGDPFKRSKDVCMQKVQAK